MFDFARMRTLADISRAQASVRPDAIAQIHDGRTTTYRELDIRASRVANGLGGLSLAKGDRVAFLGKNSDLYFELLLGSLKAGTVMTGINWRLAVPEIAYILNDSGAEVLFVTREFYETAATLKDECPRVRMIVAMDGGHAEWKGFEDWRDAQAAADPFLTITGDDDVIQLYTSGTTGHPKGVQLTDGNYLALFSAAAAAGWADYEAGEVNLTVMPVFHVAGVNMGLMSLAQGAVNVVQREVDLDMCLDLLQAHKVNNVFLVPAVILFLLLHPRTKTTDFGSLKRIFYGASPIAEDTLRQAQALFGCGFYQLYGMTETGGGGTCLGPEDHAPEKGKLRSCGKPYPGFDIRIVDGDGRTLPAGEVGEIQIRCGAVMKGYWNKPEATAKTVSADGWLATGDAGFFDDDGYLFIHDRVKDMIVSGGENIYPAEVENALFGHPAVADAGVIGVPDEKWGEAVKAIVVLKPGQTVDAAELIAYARTRIAGYKVPKSIDFVASLPRNPSGKILRRELREPYWAGRDRRVN